MVHELGHFLVAKLTGCRVDEFAFGFPPTLWKKKYGETEYKFNIIPIGGYVKIWGEDGSNQNDKRLFNNRPKWAQLLVLFAGVAMNWLLAIIIFFAVARGNATVEANNPVYKDKILNPKMYILDVTKNSPAYMSGIRSDYEVLSIESGGKVADLSSSIAVKKFITENVDSDIIINWKNGNDKGVSTVTGVYGILPDGKKGIGIAFDVLGQVKLNTWDSLVYAFQNTWFYTKETVLGLGTLGKGLAEADKQVLDNVSGPIGIAKIVSTQAENGSIVNVFTLAAILSINLAVFNLLPVPALDGGRILMVIYEAITRKKITHKISSLINGVGFILLILLLIIVTINDIFK